MCQRGGEDIRVLNLYRNSLGDAGFGAINQELLQPESSLQTLNVGYNNIEEIRLHTALDTGALDKVYSVINLILEGNQFKTTQLLKLSTLLSIANTLTYVSLKNCQLGNDGLIYTFEQLENLKRVQTIDYSSNNIFNEGLLGIVPFIGNHRKSIISKLKFNNNKISDKGLIALFNAIEKQDIKIKELSFNENDLMDDAALFVI